MSDTNDAYMDRIKASMIDSFTDFISIADTNRKIIYYNPAAYKMMGYSPDENPDIWTTAKLHAPGFDEFARDNIQPAVFKNGSWNGISAIRHKDGSTIVVDMTVFPLYGPEGEEYGTVAVIRDVNELTKMNQRLKKSSELFQKVLDSAGIGVVLINMETNTIEMVNKFTENMLMMPADEIVGKKCYDILCHNHVAFCPHINEKEKTVLVGERYLERKDGTFLPIIKTGTWITIDESRYLVDTFVDITIQKELEKNFEDAKIAAEAASRSKSEFLSRMSHEMRTPLSAVIGMTQISEKANDVIKLKECIDTIKLSSNHLLGLINDILDLSKIEEGKLELSIGAFSIQSMLEKISLLIAPKAKEKDIHFDIKADKKIPPLLMGDALRLSQVLLNFLSNAVKFTPKTGKISLAIKVNEIQGDNISLHFAVSDSGIGITEEQLSRLFAPFVQADGLIAQKYGGTGLGLVISKNIVGLMGGEITVDTKPGEGTVFSFDIVLPVADDESILSDEQAFDNIAGLFAGKRALIVDDVELNRVIAAELLAETGIAMDEATDGAQAVEMAAANTYDVILMDVRMPIMDGYEATRKIRQLDRPFCGVPIIAMSANVFKEDVEHCLAEGMNAHVGKPMDINALIAVMNRLFSGVKKNPDKRVPQLASFKSNIQETDYDKNYFNYELALEQHGHNSAELAHLCDKFLQSNFYHRLKSAMESKDYMTAKNLSANLLGKTQGFTVPSLTSYLSNLQMNLERQNYDFAHMYLRDLEKCYYRTCEIISSLLQK